MNAAIRRLALLIAAALLFGAVQRPILAGNATWSVNPISADWDAPQNWMPNTIPNGVADTATFSTSNLTQPVLSGLFEVAGINFESGADSFTIHAAPESALGTALTLSGPGIVNTSGRMQSLVFEFNEEFTSGAFFKNAATAGEMTSFGGAGQGVCLLRLVFCRVSNIYPH